MRKAIRKPLGAFLLLLLILAWAMTAMAVPQGRIQEAARGWQMLYYVLAGIGWVLPAGLLIRWMERPDPESRG